MFSSPLNSADSCNDDRRHADGGGRWAGPRVLAGAGDDDELRVQVSKRFSLKGTIGKGTTGVVYRAKQRSDGKQVALKVIHPSAKPVKEAQREYERLQLLQQPNINRALDFFIAGGISVLVLEFIPGLQLPGAVKQAPGGRLLELNARELCIMLLSAVGHMHEKGLVHGDVKPLDVLVSEDLCQLKLVDLGSAFEASSALSRRPSPACREAQATTAPEVLLGEPPSTCSDMWQVGLCLFLMLAGKMPQERDSSLASSSESSKIVTRRHISIRDPQLWHLSDACKSALRHCLAVDKHERPTAEQLLGGEWMRSNRTNTATLQSLPTEPLQDGTSSSPLGNCLLLPGLEPAVRGSSKSGSKTGRPSSARPRSAKPSGERERRSGAARGGKTPSCPLDKLVAPLSQTSTQPSSCQSLKEGGESWPMSEPVLSSQDRATVEICRSRKEVAKVLLANRLDGTYKVRMSDGSVRTINAEDAQPSMAVEIVRPKRELAKVLLANRMDGTYKVRLADGSTKIVSAEDVEGSPSSSEEHPTFVEVVQPHRETAVVLLASRMDGTYKVRMCDGSVKVVNAEEVHAGAAAPWPAES